MGRTMGTGAPGGGGGVIGRKVRRGTVGRTMGTGAPGGGGGVIGRKRLRDWNEKITLPTLSGHMVSFVTVSLVSRLVWACNPGMRLCDSMQ